MVTPPQEVQTNGKEELSRGPDGAQTPYKKELVEAVQAWNRAKEESIRCNRNLLQYGAGIAAVLGIGSGSGGVFAVADKLNVNGLPIGALVGLGVLGGVLCLGFVVLSYLIVEAFTRREAAERKADDSQTRVIALAPSRFLPEAE